MFAKNMLRKKEWAVRGVVDNSAGRKEERKEGKKERSREREKDGQKRNNEQQEGQK